MTPKSIEYFLAVAEELNYTRAAQRLYISQQALSAQIKRLEEEYGVTLFERRPSLHLTEEGRQMQFYGRQILQSEQNLRRALSDISENCRATLRVGMSRLRGSVLFPAIYRAYHEAHPNISVELVSGNTDQLEQMMMDGRLDVYLGMDVAPNSFEEQIVIGIERPYCFMSRGLLERYYPDTWQRRVEIYSYSLSLCDVLDLPLISLRSGARTRDAIDRLFANQTRPHFILECDQSTVAYRMASQGIGAAIVMPVVRDIGKGGMEDGSELYAFPLADVELQCKTSLVYRSDLPLAIHTRDFIDLATEMFRENETTAHDLIADD